jgi:hypothetical protein
MQKSVSAISAAPGKGVGDDDVIGRKRAPVPSCHLREPAQRSHGLRIVSENNNMYFSDALRFVCAAWTTETPADDSGVRLIHTLPKQKRRGFIRGAPVLHA